ncbi:MAG TPA: hypothetical protein VLS45_07605, partial [Methylomicrobium sp.]|nr:hypothetical protein [Methylomicrobium sp.]
MPLNSTNSTPAVSTLVIDKSLLQKQLEFDFSTKDVIEIAFESGLFFAAVFVVVLILKKFYACTHGLAVSRDPSIECIDERSHAEHCSKL